MANKYQVLILDNKSKKYKKEGMINGYSAQHARDRFVDAYHEKHKVIPQFKVKKLYSIGVTGPLAIGF